MAKKERKELARVCEYCEHAKTICDEEYVLCEIKGPVVRGHKCRKFAYDPLKRAPIAPRMPESFCAEDFKI